MGLSSGSERDSEELRRWAKNTWAEKGSLEEKLQAGY